MHEAVAFGRTWRSGLPLAAFSPATGAPSDETLPVIQREALEERGQPVHKSGNGELYPDGLRLFIRDEASFDIRSDGSVEWVKGSGWTGRFPPETCSIVAATAVAMTGGLPLHGSAVEIDGQGVLLCGPGGAGKSTLAAGFCAIGARLVSDDLTVVTEGPAGTLQMHPGRRSIRLFPAMARELAGLMTVGEEPEGPRGKLLVYPAMAEPTQPVPLQSIVLLEPAGAPAPDDGSAPIADTLLRIQFRPRWMTHLPGSAGRLALLDRVARQVPLRRYRTRSVEELSGLEAVAREVAEVALQ